MDKLIFLSGNRISGAEIVLKDYLKNTNLNFDLITSISIAEKKYFDLKNIKVLGRIELESLNSREQKFKKILKIKDVLKVRNFLKKQIIDKKIIILNNTIDIFYFSFINKNKIKIILFIHDLLELGSMESKIILLNDKKVNKYVAVSMACKLRLIEIGIERTKIEVIYNGIKIKKLNLKEKKENVYLFIGMLCEIKNPLEFIKFIEEISKKEKYKAKIIFKYYEEKLLYKIKNIINEKKLNIELLRDLKREEVEMELKKAKYLIVCSRKDTLPTVILEGMNNSTFIVGKNIGGIPEMVTNTNGILYNHESEIEDVVKKILNITEKEYINKILKSHQLLYKKFNNDLRTEKIDDLIKNI